MQRIMLAPKATPDRGEKLLIDDCFTKFNTCYIDAAEKKLKVSYSPNYNSCIRTYEEATEEIKQRLDIKGIKYEIENNCLLTVYIPDDCEIFVQFK